MKRFKILIVLLVALLLFSSCSFGKNEQLPYRFEEENGRKYIYFDDTAFVGMGQNPCEDIIFQSWEEVMPKILNGDFTEEEMDQLRCWYQAYGPFPLPSLGDTPLVLCPEGYEKMEFVWAVAATAMNYRLYYGESEDACEVSVWHREYSQGLVENIMGAPSAPEYILSVEEDSERNATVYRIESMFGDNISQYVIYSFETNENVFYIRERYNEGDSVPSNLDMVIEQADGQWAQVTIKNLQECPSKEWLSGFGLVSAN